MLTLRPATPKDNPAVLACADAAVPFDPAGNRHWLRQRQQLDPARQQRRHYVAIEGDDGQIVGYGALEQPHAAADWLRLFVVTPAGRLGDVGQPLYDRLYQDALALGARRLVVREYMGDEPLYAFFAGHGFVETGRVWDERLAPHQARLAFLQPRLAAITAEGFTVTSLAALQAQTTDWLARLHDLAVATRPGSTPVLTPANVTRWLARILPDGLFLVQHATDPRFAAGLALAQDEDDPGRLNIDWFATRPGYRRRGLTLLLYAQAIHYAQQRDCHTLATLTADENYTLLALHAKLGFQRPFGYVTLERTLADSERDTPYESPKETP